MRLKKKTMVIKLFEYTELKKNHLNNLFYRDTFVEIYDVLIRTTFN